MPWRPNDSRLVDSQGIESYANRHAPVKVRSIPFIDKVWDVEEPDRLVKLALNFPELLSFEEQLLYKKLRDKYELPNSNVRLSLDSFDWPRIHVEWKDFKKGVQADKTSGT